MKKLLRLFICMLTLLAGAGMAVANPAINVVNAIETITGISVTNAKGSFSFSVDKMVTEVNAEEDTDKVGFFIPFPSVSNDTADIKVNVNDGKVTHTYAIGDSDTVKFVKKTDNSGVYFKYNASANYSVYFTAELDGLTYSSSIYSVKVTGVSYSFNVDSANAIPSIAGVSDKMLVPTISVQNSNGDEMTTDISVEVLKNTNVIAVSDDGELQEIEGKLYLIPASVGTYTIRYKSTAYNLSKDYDINVTEDFDSSKVELSAKTLTMKTVELGSEATFPKAEVSDKYHNLSEVNVDTQISILKKDGTLVKKLDKNTYTYKFEQAGSYIVKYEISNFYLNNQKTKTIQIAEDVVVSDTIAPVVSFASDYSALDQTTDAWEESVVKQGDYAVPTKVGYNGIIFPALYAEDQGTKYANLEFQRVLVSNNGVEYDIDDKEDNASLADDYVKDITKPVSFTFHKKGTETDDEFVDRIKGTYTLTYRATETVGASETKRTGVKSVSIQILGVDAGTYNDETHLTINLPTITSEMKSGDSKVVTILEATDDVDKAIETHYYYYYGNKNAVETAYSTHKGAADFATGYNGFYNSFNTSNKMYDLNVENKKLTIELEEFESQPYITVVAVAINDQGHFVIDTAEVKIKNATTDPNAPTAALVASSAFDKASYVLGQDTKVELPSVVFTDDLDDHMAISAKYYIDKPENGLKPVNGGSYTYDTVNKTATMSGAYINPSQAGVYYVVYTARDDSNNSYDFVTSFEVTKETVYSIKVDYDKTLDIYGSTEINAVVVDDEGNETDDVVSIEFSGLVPECEDSTYTFNYAGDYSFVAKATISGKEVVSGKCVIKVNDVKFVWNNEKDITVPSTSELSPSKEYELLTVAPEDFTTNYSSYYKLVSSNYEALTTAETFVADTFYKKNELVYVQISVPTANQNGHTVVADVKVTNPSGEEVELIDVIVDGFKTGDVKFLAQKEGQYKVTFSVGNGDNKISKTLITQVGDNNKPVVKISNKSKLEENVVYTDEKITYKLTYKLNSDKSNDKQNVYTVTVTAKTESKTIYSYDSELVLYDIDRVGNKVALTWANAIKNDSIKLNDKTSENSSEYVWTISSIGDYTLTIKCTDTNGVVSNAETIKFKVTDEPATTEKKDNKAGIILMVISILVLAGLVCFFAFSGKGRSVAPKAKKEKKEEVEDKSNQE